MTRQRRLQQVRDHCGQAVVVAELDLVHADGVVFVDDRHGVVFEQGVQRVPHVEIAWAAVEVLMREQELGGVAAMMTQALIVSADQVRLADRGGRLELPQVVGSSLEVKLADPGPDGTRADQRNLAARVHHGADLLGKMVDAGGIERPFTSGQDAGAHLHDPDAGGENNLVAHEIVDSGGGRWRYNRTGRTPRPRLSESSDIRFVVQESTSRTTGDCHEIGRQP